MTPPELPLAVAVVLVAIGLVLAATARRARRARAVPPGPRTVAELVELRGTPVAPERAAPVPPVPVASVPIASVPVVSGPVASGPVVSGPVVSGPGPDAVVEVGPEDPVETAPERPVPNGFAADAPWRRGALIAAPVDVRPATPRTGTASGTGVQAVAAPGIAGPAVADTPARPEGAEPDLAPSPEEPATPPTTPVFPPPVVTAPIATAPIATAPIATAQVVTAPAVPDDPAEPARQPGPTAEQTAADLALLRTFGAADLESRPDRAPDVALTRSTPPAPQPVAGAPRPVRFRVVRRSGDTVADAAVSLLDAAGREAATALGGTGELVAPGPGSYLLVATAAGHQAGALALCVADEPVETEVLLVRSAALRGTVLGEDGPVAGARITLVQDGEIVEAARAAEDGRFRIDGLAAGEYAVSVAAAGCEPDVGLVVVADEAEAVHDVELGPAGVTAGWGEGG